MRKSLKFLVSTNASEIILTLAATGLGPPVRLSAMQLLWINRQLAVRAGLYGASVLGRICTASRDMVGVARASAFPP